MQKLLWTMILAGSLMYGGSRLMQDDSGDLLAATVRSGPAPALMQQILAGPYRGMVADYNILAVFTLYDQIEHTLPESQKQTAWKQLTAYLNRTSDIDPWFMDTYRLASGLLAYSDYGTEASIAILEKGSRARTWDWELPFLAGFIAYDRMGDSKLAFDFMKTATERPGVPPVAIGLASRMLNQEQGVEASIMFLQYLLSTMPQAYHDRIRKRIRELRLQEHKLHRETTH